MKKMCVRDVVNIYGVINEMKLNGVPMDDFKALIHFRGEARPIVDGWNAMLTDAVEKLKGDTMTEAQLHKYLNEALADEAKRVVEITPFEISIDAENIILSQSNVTGNDLDIIRAMVKPLKE